MVTSTDAAYDAAIKYAADLGSEHGRNAAGWYVQDTIGGRVSGDPVKAARYLLRGIEDGDPAVLDTFPFADLSGEWADSLTGSSLTEDALRAANLPGLTDDSLSIERAELFTDICDAYESAFSDAVSTEIERAAREILA